MPFRLAISAIIISLVIPICADCLTDGVREISRMAALSISKDLSEAIFELAEGNPQESRLLRVSDSTELLDPDTKIRVGDAPCGRYRTAIVCIDGSGWTHTSTPNLNGQIECVCSHELETFEIGHGCGDLKMTKSKMGNLTCIWVGEI